MSGKKMTFFVGMAVSLGFVLFAIAKLDFHRAIGAMLGVHVAWLLPLAAFWIVGLYVRSKRLRSIMIPLKLVPVKTLFSSVAICCMGNMVFPMRLGELMMVYVLAKKESLRKGGVLASVVLERVFDIFSLLVLVAATLMVAKPAGVSPETLGRVKGFGMVAAVMAVAGMVFLYLLSSDRSGVSKLVDGLLCLLPNSVAQRCKSITESFRSGLQVFAHGGHVGAVIFYSSVMYALNIVFYIMAFLMFGLPFSPEVALVTSTFVIVGVALPSSPGSIGPFHAAIILGLGLYGVDAGTALGVAIFMHALLFLGNVSLGIYLAWKEKIGLTELRRSEA